MENHGEINESFESKIRNLIDIELENQNNEKISKSYNNLSENNLVGGQQYEKFYDQNI